MAFDTDWSQKVAKRQQLQAEKEYQDKNWSSGSLGGGVICGGLGDSQAGTAKELGQAWSGDPNQQTQHVCSACGYCPCCGRGGYNPPLPYYGPVWVNPYPQTTIPTIWTTSANIN